MIHYARFYKISLCLFIILPITGCFGLEQVIRQPYTYPVADHYHSSQPYSSQSESYDIPPGHLPPPGECRIWYPDRPAGHQPPPGNCHKLQKKVPAGARLIRG